MINFEKWHGNGNDFVIINSIEESIKLKKSFIKRIADRNMGVGFDQLIHIGLPTKGNHDFFVKFYNADGSEAGMCLNGIRCASSYVWKKSLAPKREINLRTKHMNIKCSPKGDSQVSALIRRPCKIDNQLLDKKLKKIISDDIFLSNIGNNHLGIKMQSVEKVDLNMLYKKLEKLIKSLDINLSIFTKKDKFIQIRTYENGVGETLSCGSAALCVASYFINDKAIKIKSFGGQLRFENHQDGILMSGPTNFIYKGNIDE